MELTTLIKNSELHMSYLNNLNNDWFSPSNNQSFDGYKGCFKLSQDLHESGFLEKSKLKNGLIQFRKLNN